MDCYGQDFSSGKDITAKIDIQLCFTHYWVTGFGWENTVFCPSDFTIVEQLGENDIDGRVFIAFNRSGGKHILKGHYQ